MDQYLFFKCNLKLQTIVIFNNQCIALKMCTKVQSDHIYVNMHIQTHTSRHQPLSASHTTWMWMLCVTECWSTCDDCIICTLLCGKEKEGRLFINSTSCSSQGRQTEGLAMVWCYDDVGPGLSSMVCDDVLLSSTLSGCPKKSQAMLQHGVFLNMSINKVLGKKYFPGQWLLLMPTKIWNGVEFVIELNALRSLWRHMDIDSVFRGYRSALPSSKIFNVMWV